MAKVSKKLIDYESLRADAEAMLDKAKHDKNKKLVEYYTSLMKKADHEIQLQKIRNSAELNEAEKKYQEERLEAEYERKKKTATEIANSYIAYADEIGSKLTSKITSAMDKFIEQQKAFAYAFTGTTNDNPVDALKSVVRNLNDVLGANGIIKQETLYNNLQKLVKSGIVYNAESRAFLQSVSDELEMGFDVSNSELTRLINIQRTDITSQRMMIQNSLKTFLNQNYETSQYIKNGFTEVSAALLEAQSAMSVTSGVALEESVQKWLGAFSSVGVSTDTINSLASALGKFASGDLSGLDSGIGKLLLMGVASGGGSISSILSGGLSGSNAQSLLANLANYAKSFNNSDSLVVQSELAKTFGLKLSDLKALNNLDTSRLLENNSVTSNGIDEFVNSIGSKYSNFATQMETVQQNILYTMGMNVASSPTAYTIQKSIEQLAEIGSTVLSGIELSATPMGVGTKLNWANILKAVPNAALLLNGAISSFGAMGTGKNYFSKLNSTESQKILGNASSFGTVSGFGESVSAVSNTSTDDMQNATLSELDIDTDEMESEADIDDLHNDLLNMEGFLSEEVTRRKTLDDATSVYQSKVIDALATLTGLSLLTGNTTKTVETSASVSIDKTQVQVTNSADQNYMQNVSTITAINVQNIYQLLLQHFGSSKSAASVSNTGNTLNEFNDSFRWQMISTPVGQ